MRVTTERARFLLAEVDRCDAEMARVSAMPREAGDCWSKDDAWNRASHAQNIAAEDAGDVAVDALRDLLDARAEVEKITRERDAYRRAKSENDDRFMNERDAARAEVAALTQERDEALGKTVRGALYASMKLEIDTVRAALSDMTDARDRLAAEVERLTKIENAARQINGHTSAWISRTHDSDDGSTLWRALVAALGAKP